jgi:hypothetical protein
MNGIHEVTGSIPVSSTNSSNSLAKRPWCQGRFVSCLCLVSVPPRYVDPPSSCACQTGRTAVVMMPVVRFTAPVHDGGTGAETGADVGREGCPGYPWVPRIDRARVGAVDSRPRSCRTQPSKVRGLSPHVEAETEGARQGAEGNEGPPADDQTCEQVGASSKAALTGEP